MVAASRYIARQPDDSGFIAYSADEHSVWRELFATQRQLLPGRACAEFIDGLIALQLPATRIPQCTEVSARLGALTGWRIKPVEALISHQEFFTLLAARIFPAASFIRRREEFGYLQEPDVFHELFGHTPLLTHPVIADFSQKIGEAGCAAGPEYHDWLARLYWMTIEFGLIDTPDGLRAYGAGIISSPEELRYALESPAPQRLPFDPLTALRTSYRIDELQPRYFVLESFDQLSELTDRDLISLIDAARSPELFA